MRLSDHGVNLIKEFEGLALAAYRDIAGVWTIGFGHTETAGPDQKISERAAIELLRADLHSRERAVDALISAPLNQNEFDALVSLVYNIGAADFERSTVRKRLNAGNRAGAAEAMTWWNKATVNGVLREVAGLTRRRNAERELFLTPVAPRAADGIREDGNVKQPGIAPAAVARATKSKTRRTSCESK